MEAENHINIDVVLTRDKQKRKNSKKIRKKHCIQNDEIIL
jgi:hypothetical protein